MFILNPDLAARHFKIRVALSLTRRHTKFPAVPGTLNDSPL